MNAPDNLLKAADIIEERGWNQGGFIPSFSEVDPRTCPVCVLAAINVATGHDPDEGFEASGDSQDAAIALADYLGLTDDLGDHEVDGIETVVGNAWNDMPGRVVEDVTTALRECATELTRIAS